MRRMNLLTCLVFVFLVALSPAGRGQSPQQNYLTATGSPNFSVNIPVPNGYINIANGNLHLEIPIATLKQRGNLNLNERLVYDSRIWEIIQYHNYYWWPLNVPNSSAGWRFVKGNELGTMGFNNYKSLQDVCAYQDDGQPSGYSEDDDYSMTWTDPAGTSHLFDARIIDIQNDSCTGNNSSTFEGGYATDASGYSVSDDGTGNPLVKDANGNEVYPSVIDRFGNYWSTNGNGDLVDDLGRVPVITTQNGNVTYYDVLAPNGPISNNGTRVRYTVTYEQVPISTHFNQQGVTEYQNNNGESPTIPAVQSIQLPDGSAYQFGYDSYGSLQAMTLPTGGTVSYGWSNYTDSYQNVNHWLTSSTINGYQTSYTPSVITQCSSNGTGCQEQVNVHRPSGDETVYTMTLNNGAWNTATTIYAGPASSNAAKFTDATTYNFSNSCYYTAVCSGAQYITKATETQSLPDAGLSTQITTGYTYPEKGQLTSTAQWDYFATGSTPSATPTRQVNYVYTGYDVTSETHLDSSGNIASATTYNYTGTATATSGIVGHGTANAGGPYLTSITVSDNAPTATFTTSNVYDDTGTLLSTTDADNHPATTFQHDPTDTFVTEVDRPTIGNYKHVSKATYDAGSGAVLTTDDENSVAHNQAYTVHYTYEPVAGRIQSVTHPDGGSTTYSYPSYTQTTTTEAQSGSVNVTTSQILDSYGRPSQTITGGITVTQTYDGNGRQYSISSPIGGTPSPTDGVTYTSYDTLNRVNTITNPDGSIKSASYVGNVATGTDELGNQKKQTFDAFGEIVSVVEADPSTGALTLETDYQHDALGNLTCIEQHGNVSGTGCSASPSSDGTTPWRVRRFYYDQLSRLRAAEIPEHTGQWSSPASQNYFPPSQNCGTPDNQAQWTDCYLYDANGNMTSSWGNTGQAHGLAYTYDALNRLTLKSGTLRNEFHYDGAVNGIGRLQSQSNDVNATSFYGYDVMGRLTLESACRPSNCSTGNYQNVSATYDWAGNMTSMTYPDGRVMQTTYDSLNRPTSLIYQQWGTQAVGTTYWSNPSYAPPGQLLAAQYGPSSQTSPALQLQAAFNNRQLVTSLSYTAPGGTVFGKGYQWAVNGSNLNMETVSSTGQQRQFGYDKLNRLISAVDIGQGSNATASITISGMEGSNCVGGGSPPIGQSTNAQVATANFLPPGKCTIVWDTGIISVTIGSFTASISSGKLSTPTKLATGLAGALNGNGSPVSAPTVTTNSDGSATINIVSGASGPSGDYPLSSSSDNDFTISLSGSSMTGGQGGAPTPGGLNQQYVLDNWGNLSSMGNSGFTQLVNKQNQIGSYLYDAAGRITSDPTLNLTYTYDDNSMLSASTDGESYVYDAANQRIAVASAGALSEYYFFGGALIATQSPSSGMWTDMLRVGSAKIGYVVGSVTASPTFVATDHLGSEVASVDSSGNVLSAIDYAPFGQVIAGSSTDGFIFTGLQHDGSGLDHAYFRQYSSLSSKWTVPDPFAGSYLWSDPQTLNRYSYVKNMPLFLSDTNGLNPEAGGGGEAGAIPCYTAITSDGAAIPGDISCAVEIYELIKDIVGLFKHPEFKGNVKAERAGKTVRSPQNWLNSDSFGVAYPGLGGAVGGALGGSAGSSCEFGACSGGPTSFQSVAAAAPVPAVICAAAEPCGAIAVGATVVVVGGIAAYQNKDAIKDSWTALADNFLMNYNNLQNENNNRCAIVKQAAIASCSAQFVGRGLSESSALTRACVRIQMTAQGCFNY